MSEGETTAIEQLKESPEDYCIRIATDWGTVFVRHNLKRRHWTKSVWLPDENAESGQWYESRVYSDELSKLLGHEHGVQPMNTHPNH